MKLETMNLVELQELQLAISSVIIKKTECIDFWKEQEVVGNLKKEIELLEIKIVEFISNSTVITKAIEENGYRVIYYSQDSVGFINYSMPKIEGKHYGFSFKKGSSLQKNRDDVKEADLQKLQKILGV